MYSLVTPTKKVQDDGSTGLRFLRQWAMPSSVVLLSQQKVERKADNSILPGNASLGKPTITIQHFVAHARDKRAGITSLFGPSWDGVQGSAANKGQSSPFDQWIASMDGT
mmetsp:Transcript_3847/g.10530  ORF Transcript_3847/g.10530 Transcript_3847/m.10530 type:complete len:110 (-) Transcript_3847:317-646(-)